MSDGIQSRSTLTRPDRMTARTPSQSTRPHRAGPAGWRHGSIDEGDRLDADSARLASERIRAALLIGDWPGAVAAMLSARGGIVDAKGLEIEPNERGPALTDVEADYVVALCECHLTRTDLVVGAQELCRLSWWSAELSLVALDRARWIAEPRQGTASKGMAERRAVERLSRAEYFQQKKGEVA